MNRLPSELQGFNFADARSRHNAVKAMNPDRPAAFLIAGPLMTGKTLLAQRIFQKLFGCCPAPTVCISRRRFQVDMDRAVDLGFLWLDNVPDKFLTAPELGRLVTTKGPYSMRRLGEREGVTVMVNCLTVVTTHADFIPSDLARRFKIIRLANREGGN